MKYLQCAGAFMLVACGGIVVDVSEGGTPDASAPACPPSPPVDGSPCAAPVVCEYGTDPDQHCNVIAQCTELTLRWRVVPGSDGAQCPTPPNGSTCPPSYTFTTGQPCDDVGFTCSYPQGFCGCAPYGYDAGAPGFWACDEPQQGCPMPRPKEGSACSQPNQICDYGDCFLPTGVTLGCTDGLWEDTAIVCP